MKKSSGEALLLDLILSAKDHKSLKILLSEICTPGESAILGQRVATAQAILDQMTYRQIKVATGSSSYTISRAKDKIIKSKNQYIVRYITGLKPKE